jgi:hypothetical protein
MKRIGNPADLVLPTRCFFPSSSLLASLSFPAPQGHRALFCLPHPLPSVAFAPCHYLETCAHIHPYQAQQVSALPTAKPWSSGPWHLLSAGAQCTDSPVDHLPFESSETTLPSTDFHKITQQHSGNTVGRDSDLLTLIPTLDQTYMANQASAQVANDSIVHPQGKSAVGHHPVKRI